MRRLKRMSRSWRRLFNRETLLNPPRTLLNPPCLGGTFCLLSHRSRRFHGFICYRFILHGFMDSPFGARNYSKLTMVWAVTAYRQLPCCFMSPIAQASLALFLLKHHASSFRWCYFPNHLKKLYKAGALQNMMSEGRWKMYDGWRWKGSGFMVKSIEFKRSSINTEGSSLNSLEQGTRRIWII